MKRILIAYDGGEPAQRALATAADLAKRYGATVGVISVVPVRAAPIGIDPWDDRAEHERELVEAQSRLREQGIEPELIEPYGDPAWTIEKVARDRDYDTIVVGSRGLGAVSRFLQGSVSDHVASHSSSTVVIAR
jgi:nucleotide-binding universal stress UspA family protein